MYDDELFMDFDVEPEPIHLHYSILSDGTATVADVEIIVNGELVFHGSGSSRRVKGDRYDAELGDVLAIQRALDCAVRSMAAFTGRKIAAMDKTSEVALQASIEAHPAGKGRRR